ncbi:hypothetical protein EDC01DRAFT_726411 [Geopyxis carbonaria]|nr:hypothetical protein EDC01DRAFT_726411 [Geopyxis carbonaria]
MTSIICNIVTECDIRLPLGTYKYKLYTKEAEDIFDIDVSVAMKGRPTNVWIIYDDTKSFEGSKRAQRWTLCVPQGTTIFLEGPMASKVESSSVREWTLVEPKDEINISFSRRVTKAKSRTTLTPAQQKVVDDIYQKRAENRTHPYPKKVVNSGIFFGDQCDGDENDQNMVDSVTDGFTLMNVSQMETPVQVTRFQTDMDLPSPSARKGRLNEMEIDSPCAEESPEAMANKFARLQDFSVRERRQKESSARAEVNSRVEEGLLFPSFTDDMPMIDRPFFKSTFRNKFGTEVSPSRQNTPKATLISQFSATKPSSSVAKPIPAAGSLFVPKPKRKFDDTRDDWWVRKNDPSFPSDGEDDDERVLTSRRKWRDRHLSQTELFERHAEEDKMELARLERLAIRRADNKEAKDEKPLVYGSKEYNEVRASLGLKKISTAATIMEEIRMEDVTMEEDLMEEDLMVEDVTMEDVTMEDVMMTSQM